MDKIVGKTSFKGVRYFLLFLCSVSCFLCADITMRFTDSNGVRLEQAGVGEPFTLEVVIKNMEQSMQAPVIVGIEQFQARRTGFTMNSINGKSTLKYTYQLRIDAPGTYKIGPAVVINKGFKFASSKLTVTVGEQSLAQKKQSKNKQAKTQTFLRLSCDKGNAVVGEKLTCVLAFFTNDSLVLNNVIEQEFSGFSRQKMREPRKGTQKIDGVAYNCVEWRWDMYPTEAGNKMIPAYGIDFEQYVQRDNFWGGFGRLLGPRAEDKRIYSNSLQIKVDQLPSSDKSVTAIGSVLTAHASIKPGLSKKGEGMVLTLDLEGDGDIASIAVPKLRGMPEALRYYDSQQEVIEPTEPGGLVTKRFEYIVQGLSCGSWEIPRQTFDYFDVTTRKYKAVETNPLLVTVVADAASHYTAIDSDQTMGAQNEQQGKIAVDDLCPLHADGQWHPACQGRSLPWWLVMLLGVVPFFVWAYRGVVPRWQQYRAEKQPFVRSKKAFVIARRSLKQAQTDYNSSQIYAIFVQLMADRYRWLRGQISEPIIEKKLRDAGMDAHRIAEWNAFFTQTAAHVYGQLRGIKEQEALFTQAWYWIEQLEKVL